MVESTSLTVEFTLASGELAFAKQTTCLANVLQSGRRLARRAGDHPARSGRDAHAHVTHASSSAGKNSSVGKNESDSGRTPWLERIGEHPTISTRCRRDARRVVPWAPSVRQLDAAAQTACGARAGHELRGHDMNPRAQTNASRSEHQERSSTELVWADPPRPYAGAVVAMSGYRQHGPQQKLHRGLPSAVLTMVIGIDGPIVVADAEDDPRAVRAHAIIGALAPRHALILQPRPREGVQVLAHPLASRWLFGAPASRLPGAALDMSEVVGSSVGALQQRLGEAPDWVSRFRAIEQFIALRAQAATGSAAASPRAEVVEGLRWIARRGGNGRMDDLAAHVALGPRRLRDVFVDELGLGPKALSRVMRFQRTVAMVRAGAAAADRGTLADIAARAGFSDHAHLDREFHGLAGTTPSAWIREERAQLQAHLLSRGAEMVRGSATRARPAHGSPGSAAARAGRGRTTAPTRARSTR